MLKNTRNIWQLVMHWEHMFLCGIIKCSSRTCPFMGIHIPKLGNIECSQLGTPCSVMGIHVPFMGKIDFLKLGNVLFPHVDICFVISTQECVFLHVPKHQVNVFPNCTLHLGNFGPQVPMFNIVFLVWAYFVPILKWQVPMLSKELELTFKLYFACSLNLQIMMPIQNANNMQGNVFTLV